MTIESRSWTELSSGLVDLVRRVADSVVRVEGGRRGPSSGVVWAGDGTIVTAAHGLDDDAVEIGLASGDTVDGVVVGRDPSTDLAVIRPRGSAAFAPAAWTDATLEVGQLVFTVTRPGRGPRAGAGLVSRLGDGFRTSAGGKLDRYVELDVGLHAGFSGGLVLDTTGRGIGLASAGVVRGAPLAIPVTTLRRVVASLVAHGAIRRGYVGIATLPVRVTRAVRGATQDAGLLVTAVEDDSPAATAGLMVGDLLLAIDGAGIERVGDLLGYLDEERIGAVVHARILRAGEPRDVAVTIGVRR